MIDDESGSEEHNKEKFSSQPVATQPLESKQFAKPLPNTDKKHKLKRRSRSRGGLNAEDLFREALAQ